MHTREALAIEVDQGIKGEQVVEAMTRLALMRGAPRTIRVDNGPEVRLEGARSLGLRERRHARLQPTRQADGQCLRRVVNGRLRDECLNTHWFLSVTAARTKIETWRRHYNESRPHTALGWKTPSEYAAAAALTATE